jgi:hypothetical protein
MFRDAEKAKYSKHILSGATALPLAMSLVGKLAPAAAEAYLLEGTYN